MLINPNSIIQKYLSYIKLLFLETVTLYVGAINLRQFYEIKHRIWINPHGMHYIFIFIGPEEKKWKFL